MRTSSLALAICLAGCGELSGAATYAEVGPIDTGLRDAVTDSGPPPGLNDLDGYFAEEPIPKTRAIYRLDRASAAGNPRVVFISTTEAVTFGCETFRAEGWHTRLPKGAMIHVLELGSVVPATFTIRRDAEPAADGATFGRAVESSGPLSLQRAARGTVTISAANVTTSSGTLEAAFEVFIDDDPMPYEEKVKASFVAPACAVD